MFSIDLVDINTAGIQDIFLLFLLQVTVSSNQPKLRSLLDNRRC